jgi:hypothetical protein
MKIYTYDDVEYRSFTYEEEQDLARFVMDLLSQLWVREGFVDILESIYYSKLHYGFNIKSTDWDELIYFLDTYSDNIDRFGIEWPSFTDDDKDVRDTVDKNDTEETMRTIQLAWKEIWINHSTFHGSAEKYRLLPKDRINDTSVDDDYTDDMIFLERLRTDAITQAIADNPELSYGEACIYIRDFIPRRPEDLG